MNNNDYITILKDFAKTMVDTFYVHDKSDKTFKAMITEKVKEKKYKVLYCGKNHLVSSSIPCEVGDFVRVCAPSNNWDDLFVVCKV